MFLYLLCVTFVVALAVSGIVDALFRRPIGAILDRVVGDSVAFAWARYVRFALYVVGISCGVSIWNLERFVTPRRGEEAVVVLTPDRWVLEVYRTVVETLQGCAWMLLVFFAAALAAYILVRVIEAVRRPTPA